MKEYSEKPIERRSVRLSSPEFKEAMDRLGKEPFDEFLVDATQLAFAVSLPHGHKYPVEIIGAFRANAGAR